MPSDHPYPTSSSLAVVALGANLGKAVDTLQRAAGLLRQQSAGGFRLSSFYASAPVDCPPGSPPFVNAAAVFQPRAGETPESLLACLQLIEKRFGRRPKQIPNEPRPLDLDLIAFGREVRSAAELVLPHPRAHQRRFVLAPLAEIVPDFILPGQQLPVAALLQRLPPGGLVERLKVELK